MKLFPKQAKVVIKHVCVHGLVECIQMYKVL